MCMKNDSKWTASIQSLKCDLKFSTYTAAPDLRAKSVSRPSFKATDCQNVNDICLYIEDLLKKGHFFQNFPSLYQEGQKLIFTLKH